MSSEDGTSPYQIFMLGLSVYVLAALASQRLLALTPDEMLILDRADAAICFVFMADFVRSLATASNRWQYMTRWGWLDLLSSILAVDLFRWGRGARIFRILRVLRAMRAARIITVFTLERRAESVLWSTLLLAVLVMVFGSIAILHLEAVPDANILDADDALWWTFTTITTVGYGDQFPVTPAGRALGAFVMATGIGVFGAFTAYVAKMVLSSEEAQVEQELMLLREEVRELKGLMEAERGVVVQAEAVGDRGVQ